jgi:hypothetical protein
VFPEDFLREARIAVQRKTAPHLSVQRIAAMAPRLRGFAAWEIAPEAVSDGTSLRHALDTRRQRRILRRRFRRDPASYLAKLEANLLQLILPP